MTESIGRFPFGEPVKAVEQRDRTPKRVFVLGVYASAVHARWVGPDGRDVVKALAVASEPYIFWRGGDAETIVDGIRVPDGLGRLEQAAPQFNGPSGKALDELFLEPLGLVREDAWLCDLVPHSCINGPQHKAIERSYLPLREKHDLPVPSVPSVPRRLSDAARREAILAEVRESQASTLLLLGDQPIRWFLRFFKPRWKRLSDFGTTKDKYGQLHRIQLRDMTLNVLPLTHPRQAAGLGQHSPEWFSLHQNWLQAAGSLLG